MQTRKLLISTGIAAAALLVAVASVAAAGPRGNGAGNGDMDRAQNRDLITTQLGLTQAELQAERAAGHSVAEIAQAKGIDPEAIVAQLAERWESRIQVRLENGAIDADQAAQLRTRTETWARNQVYEVVPGGMAGAAVGAGPEAMGRGIAGGSARMGHGAGMGPNGAAQGDGTCDGTGPHGPAGS